jgi:gliding motility-associated-like protein
VTITDANGCIITDTALIELPPPLSFSRELSDYNGYNISCNALTNGFINVEPTTGTPPFVYTWTGPAGFSASTKNISGLGAGQYTLLIVDSNECTVTETFDLTEPGQLGITTTVSQSVAGGYNINCGGDSTGFITLVPVNQVSPDAYLWSDGLYSNSRSDLRAGTYSIIVIDANNCQASITINLTEPAPMSLSLSVVPPFCPDKPDGIIAATVSGGVRGADYSYLWSDNSTSQSLTNIPAGFYKVKVTDLNGCTKKDSVIVDAQNETCLVIPNAISPNNDLINDVWNIGLKELYPLMEVKIFNRWGVIVWRSESGYPVPWDGRSNGGLLPMDSYHYIIDLHNGSSPIIGNITIVK